MKPILITGSHRSGSTWTGKVIASSNEIAYIHEPFNILFRPWIINYRIPYWFFYAKDSDVDLLRQMQKTIGFTNHPLYHFGFGNSVFDNMRILKHSCLTCRNRITKKRALIKDPLSIFSAEWYVKNFNVQVLLLIRHPLAFTASLKKGNSNHPFTHFLKQKELMEFLPKEFKAQIEEYAQTQVPIIDQAILLWNIIHYQIAEYKKNHEDWLFITHEDLSLSPNEIFRSIFNYLEIDFTKKVRNYIKKTTQASNVSAWARDSEKNIKNWRGILSSDEVNQVHHNTKVIASLFYDDKSWE